MKLLKLTLIVVVIGSLSFLFFNGQSNDENNHVAKVEALSPKVYMRKEEDRWGMKVFNDSAYAAIKGKSMKDICSGREQHEGYFCREGFYFISYIKKLNEVKKSDIINVSEHINIDTSLKALAFGMALTTRTITPADLNLSKELKPYVEDGWGFMKTILNVRKGVIEFSNLCNVLNNSKYCLFGIGRALVFEYFDISIAKKISEATEQGYLFADIFANKNNDKSNSKIQKVAQDIKGNSFNGVYKKCAEEKRNHLLDCVDAGKRP